MSHGDWIDLRGQISEFEEFALRHVWNRQVSWPLFTVEYFDSLAKLIPANARILEVCAGPPNRQILAQQMRARGVRWDATDVIAQQDALSLDYAPYDILYASWIPCQSTIDVHLANQNKPTILLGENNGCTGSVEFWRGYDDKVTAPPADFVDVLQFPYVHDCTYLLNF